MNDLIKRADAIEEICNAQCELDVPHYPQCDQVKWCNEVKALLALPSAEAEKKKAELKENGDWDCPDVGCDECDHHRSVEWCSLAIPNHEKEIDETYKMVNEAFFEGFDAAEKRYRFLIETVEELDKKLADAVSREAHYDAVANRITDMEERGFVSVVRCKDCRHRDLFSCPLADNDFQKDEDFCSWGERSEK